MRELTQHDDIDQIAIKFNLTSHWLVQQVLLNVVRVESGRKKTNNKIDRTCTTQIIIRFGFVPRFSMDNIVCRTKVALGRIHETHPHNILQIHDNKSVLIS
jgi:hypothetical protein